MSTYAVEARRSGLPGLWELHIAGVGVTQSHRLGDDAEFMVRDYLQVVGAADWDTAVLVIAEVDD
ncbi:hypothetical protein [Kineococcus rubinsiae]|uniref:hypothetical protein n=1 Tax=Kineococcus rubinsiae TaxID=2609562 RepID=UPI00142F72A1|nr:hypothetical protein [Kineococcus rubinsiae]NIZ93432.1 hypothetical protein [Kineococcus rubinsiae]